MTDQLTATGLEIDTLEDRIASVSADLRTSISAILDLSPDQPTGQLVRIVLEHVQQLAELLQEVHSAFDPDQATGASQTALALVTGTVRRDATHGTVAVTLDLDAATTVPAGTLFAVLGDPTNEWSLDADVTSVGAGPYAGTATAVIAGPYPALAATITVIVTPVGGLNSVTNAADATAGLAEETDAELRVRRELEVTQGGSTSAAAILAAVLANTEVREAACFENDTDWTSADGMPPHSVEVCYWAGAVAPPTLSADLAETILEQKAGGIQAYGSTVETVVDAAGSHQIGLTEAADRAVGLEFTLTTDSSAGYPGDAAFKAAMADIAQAQQGIGDDVLLSRWIANAFTVPGVVEVTLLRTQWIDTPGWAVTNRVITARQVATISTADMVVL